MTADRWFLEIIRELGVETIPRRSRLFTLLDFRNGLTIGLVVAALALGDMLSTPPLTVVNPDGLVAFYEQSPRGRQARLSHPLFIELQNDCRSCGQVAATHLREITFELDSTIDSIGAEFVSGEYFMALGLKAGQGRLFGQNESGQSRSETVAVVGERFCRKHFKPGTAVGSKIWETKIDR